MLHAASPSAALYCYICKHTFFLLCFSHSISITFSRVSSDSIPFFFGLSFCTSSAFLYFHSALFINVFPLCRSFIPLSSLHYMFYLFFPPFMSLPYPSFFSPRSYLFLILPLDVLHLLCLLLNSILSLFPDAPLIFSESPLVQSCYHSCHSFLLFYSLTLSLFTFLFAFFSDLYLIIVPPSQKIFYSLF